MYSLFLSLHFSGSFFARARSPFQRFSCGNVHRLHVRAVHIHGSIQRAHLCARRRFFLLHTFLARSTGRGLASAEIRLIKRRRAASLFVAVAAVAAAAQCSFCWMWCCCCCRRSALLFFPRRCTVNLRVFAVRCCHFPHLRHAESCTLTLCRSHAIKTLASARLRCEEVRTARRAIGGSAQLSCSKHSNARVEEKSDRSTATARPTNRKKWKNGKHSSRKMEKLFVMALRSERSFSMAASMYALGLIYKTK